MSEIITWLDLLVRSGGLTREQVSDRIEQTDTDLALLLAVHATGPTGRLNRARMRARLGITALDSAPPTAVTELAAVVREDSSAVSRPPWTELLSEVRHGWRTTA